MFPKMYRAGISYDEFGELTMTKMRVISNAYSEKLREDFRMSDLVAFVQGRYFVEALLCTVGNMLGKNANFKYPEQAYSLAQEEPELTEEEIEQQRQLFIASLQAMQHNFEINKEKQKVEDLVNA